jgi:hypothetical protein
MGARHVRNYVALFMNDPLVGKNGK